MHANGLHCGISAAAEPFVKSGEHETACFRRPSVAITMGRSETGPPMSLAVADPVLQHTAPGEPAWKEFARSPLVPVAVAVSVGLMAERYAQLHYAGELAAAILALAAWRASRARAPAPRASWL